MLYYYFPCRHRCNVLRNSVNISLPPTLSVTCPVQEKFYILTFFFPFVAVAIHSASVSLYYIALFTDYSTYAPLILSRTLLVVRKNFILKDVLFSPFLNMLFSTWNILLLHLCVIKTNQMHFSVLIYFNNRPLHVANRLNKINYTSSGGILIYMQHKVWSY